MNSRIVLFSAVIVTAAFAQPDLPSYVSRELQFRYASTPQQQQEIATVVRVIAELPQVSVVEASARLAIRGSQDAITTAEWLFAELDQPAPGKLPSASAFYRMPGVPSNEPAIRVFRLANAATAQALQEAATILRSIGEVRRIMTLHNPNAIAVRGTEAQIRFAEFLLGELDRPPGISATSGAEYRLPYPVRPYVRVFVINGTPAVQRLQEIATEVRQTANLGHVFTYTPLRALAVRTTPEQMPDIIKLFQERRW